METRWLIGGSSRTISEHWDGILRMVPMKQELFMKRILFLHSIAVKRGGKYSSARLGLKEWLVEADRICLLGYILQEMQGMCDLDGSKTFEPDLLGKIVQQIIEGLAGHVLTGQRTDFCCFCCFDWIDFNLSRIHSVETCFFTVRQGSQCRGR